MVSSPTYVMTITVILLLVNILMVTIIIAPTLVRAQMQSAGTNNSTISQNGRKNNVSDSQYNRPRRTAYH